VSGVSTKTSIAQVVTLVAGLSSMLGGCVAAPFRGINSQQLGPGEAAIPLGAAVRDNRTPLEAVMACYADNLISVRDQAKARSLVFSVGDIKDFTGKYSINEGNAVTQGGSLMVYSALGKLNGAVGLVERFDSGIAERELGYMDRRQLGDGRTYEVNGQKVPWVPYYGGSLAMSDFYIVGGITEVNYNISSGGAEVAVNNIGGKSRRFNQSVAVDLRLVNSRTLVVQKTISLQKQYTGYEVGAGVFRFFGLSLFDVSIGAKGQEPLQLGIRTTLEEATVRLVASATGVDAGPCLGLATNKVPAEPTDKLRGAYTVTDGQAVAVPGKAAAPAQKSSIAVKPGAVAPSARKAPAVVSAAKDVALPGKTSAPAVKAVAAPSPAPVGAYAAPQAPVSAQGPSLNMVEQGSRGTASGVQLVFEFGDTAVGGGMQAALDQVAAASKQGVVTFSILARETEVWDPAKRDALLNQRLSAIISALGNRGVPTASLIVTWRPDKADTAINRAGSGLQLLASVKAGG
jgi:curli biogenesis system outer membrane secretion channel CsgG